MIFSTHNGVFIAKKVVSDKEEETIGAIKILKSQLPTYEIISIDESYKTANFTAKVGDIVVCATEGTSFSIEKIDKTFDNDVLYMFKIDNIIGKIISS